MLKGGKFTDLYIYESLLFHAERNLLKAGHKFFRMVSKPSQAH